MIGDGEQEGRLEWISTHWPGIREPEAFVMRYGRAMRAYLGAILRDPHEAEEAMQDFLLRVVQHRFERVSEEGGRFRDYLKRSIHNAAVSQLRKRKAGGAPPIDVEAVASPARPAEADEAWRREWRRCVLEGAWRALEQHERNSPGNLFHTAITLVTQHPDEDSAALAGRAGALRGSPIGAIAFRKQLSRARSFLAERIVAEVSQGLQDPSRESLEEELAELGLLQLVKPHLT